jgi:hypothetical protein
MRETVIRNRNRIKRLGQTHNPLTRNKNPSKKSIPEENGIKPDESLKIRLFSQ